MTRYCRIGEEKLFDSYRKVLHVKDLKTLGQKNIEVESPEALIELALAYDCSHINLYFFECPRRPVAIEKSLRWAKRIFKD